MTDTTQHISSTPEANETVEKQYIQFSDLMKVELRIGTVVSAEIVEKSEKLLKLAVDFGEYEAMGGESEQKGEGEAENVFGEKIKKNRQVISGIRKQFQNPEELVGRSFVFVANLEPRPIMGFVSEAMIVAGTSPEGLALMTPTSPLPPGTLLS